MNTVEYASWMVAGAGTVLILGELPWFRHRPLVERLRPYSRHARASAPSAGPGAPLRQVLAPLLATGGARLSRALGVDTDLSTRLERAGSDDDPVAFRLRQLTWAILAGAAGAVTAIWLRPSAVISAVLLLGLPLLGALVVEQQLSAATAARQQRRRAELPVVVEQLGMLLGAGFSLTAALARLADRGSGVIADDLTTVMRRIRQGVSESDALAEWAELTGLDAIRRLVSLLGLHSEAGDLGALISEEAHAERAEAHRDLLESIERRSQLVWVPVTVATLVPGLIFLAVPFYSAMAQVTGGG